MHFLGLFAHAGHDHADGFVHGLLHPLTGADHLVALLAVGLWAAMLGGRSVWLVPTAFLAMVVIGGFTGIVALDPFYIETGIVTSLLVLGLLIALAVRIPAWAAVLVVGTFAAFHGLAHGAEMPFSASALEYGSGLVLASAAILACAVMMGLGLKSLAPLPVLRVSGAACALFGTALMIGLFL